ncbi:adenylate/guanylate cyclase domain-containing protein [Candidatus Gracilibacteria bacterium]|nr:adenylate/guanylate cyclase domain-containing protein [Candidatus Gracilibacteria bacterium]
MLKKLLKNRPFSSIFFAIIIFFVIYTFSSFGFFVSINEKINNTFMTLKSIIKQNVINKNIVLVAIDEKTLEHLGFPFSRDHYKTFIQNLNSKKKPAVIGFDIIFADKSDSKNDKIFADSIKEAGNIILGTAIINQEGNNGELKQIIEKPLDIFEKEAYSYGYFQPRLSNNSQALSFVPYAKLYDKDGVLGEYNHFAIAILKAYFGQIYKKDFRNYNQKDENHYYLKENLNIPFAKTGGTDILINYIPKPAKNKGKITNFPIYSFWDIYENNFNPDDFEDKIVIVGATARGIKDIFYTTNDIEYGVVVQANIVNMILEKNFLFYFDNYLEWILIFLLIITSIYFSISGSGTVIFFANLSIAIMFLVIYPSFAVIFNGYILNNLFELFLALPFSIMIGNIIKYLTENDNKLKLSKALSEYVSKAIVKEILSNSGDIKLDGEVRKLTIFFSDIEGFTSISERFSPQELVTFLRNYLSYMSNIILDNAGFINKYEGDAIMALWGAFSDSSRDSYHACLSAIKQQEMLKDLNKNWKELDFPEIKARIGIHTGQAIVGNIGAVGRKIEYTALGDSVNLASRLEGVNKFYGTYICISEDVYEETKEYFEFRYLDKITVKGKEKAVKIYELLSLKGELGEVKTEIISEFEKAVFKYNSRDFSGAKVIFENIYKKYSDSPSKTYVERCEYFIKNPPLEQEDLIWKFETK